MVYSNMRWLYLLPVGFWNEFAQTYFFYWWKFTDTIPYLHLWFGKGFGHSDYPGFQIFALYFQRLYFLVISENPVFESLVLLAVSEEQ